MDIVTHSLTGVMLARVWPGVSDRGGTAGWKHTALLVAAANLPDIDVVSRAWGTLSYLEYHRGYTHALIAAPLLAAALTLAARAGARLFAAAFTAVLLHLALDSMNVHGSGLLLPFSDRRIHLDTTYPTDPLIVLPMLFALAMPPLLGLVGSTVAGRKEATPKRGFAWFAIVAVALYCGARFYAHREAVRTIRELAAPFPEAIHAFPTRFSLTRWQTVVEREEETTEIPLDLATGQYRVQKVSPRQPTEHEVQDVLLASEEFRFALEFAEVPVWLESRQGDERRLILVDLRFGPSFDPQFRAEATLLRNGLIEGQRLILGPGFE